MDYDDPPLLDLAQVLVGRNSFIMLFMKLSALHEARDAREAIIN